jgi:hypothetical protein
MYLFGDIEQIIEDLQQEYENAARLEMTLSRILATHQRGQWARRGGGDFFMGGFPTKKYYPFTH